MIAPLWILIGAYFVGNSSAYLILHGKYYLGVILPLLFLTFLFSYRKKINYLFLTLLLLTFGFIHLTYVSVKLNIDPLAEKVSKGVIFLTGVVNSDIRLGERSGRFVVKVVSPVGAWRAKPLQATQSRPPAHILVYLKKPIPKNLGYYSQVKFKTALSSESDLPPGFLNRLKDKGIHHVVYLDSDQLEVLPTLPKDFFPIKAWHLFKRGTLKLKDKLITVHLRSLPPPYNSLLASLIFGTSASPLPRKLQERYRKGGVIHLLVVSGSQIALLVGTVMNLGKSMGLSSRMIFVICSLFNIGFTIATGADPSILRACFMAQLTLLSFVSKRRKDILSVLLLSAFCLCLIDPKIVWEVSFQLSFAATFSLIYVAPILSEVFKKRMPEFASTALGVTLGPQLVTTPLAMFYFSGFSIVSTLLNLIVLSWVELIVVCGFVATIIGTLFYPLGYLINQFNFALLWILDRLVYFATLIPYSYINLVAPTLPLLLMIYGLITLSLIYLKNRELFQKITAQLKTLLLVTLILFFWHQTIIYSGANPNWQKGSGELVITAIDVGQGDSILIETPDKKRILIDAGFSFGKKDMGKQRVIPLLKKKGINKLDLMILTHADQDHVGGFPSLLEEFHTSLILDSGFQTNNKTYKKFMRMIKKKKIPYQPVVSGMELNLGEDLTLRFLHPSHPMISGSHSDQNENSVVLYLKYKTFSALFTGDIGHPAEKRILELYPTLNITLLKVGHHGSRHSSSEEFLEQLSPKISFISSALKNRYKHPHPKVIDRLKKIETKIYNTGRQGNLVLKTDGVTYRVLTEREMALTH